MTEPVYASEWQPSAIYRDHLTARVAAYPHRTKRDAVNIFIELEGKVKPVGIVVRGRRDRGPTDAFFIDPPSESTWMAAHLPPAEQFVRVVAAGIVDGHANQQRPWRIQGHFVGGIQDWWIVGRHNDGGIVDWAFTGPEARKPERYWRHGTPADDDFEAVASVEPYVRECQLMFDVPVNDAVL